MKKKILSVLLNIFMIFSMIIPEATFIEYTEIDELSFEFGDYNADNLDNIITQDSELDISGNEMDIFPKATIKHNTEKTYTGYFTSADNVIYKGEANANKTTISYENTSIDNEKYVIYSNAVNYNGEKYDLIIFPFQVTDIASCNLKSTAFQVKNRGYAGYKIIITEHNNINKPINMNIMMGLADLDNQEYVILPSDFKVMHKGVYITESDSINGKKYMGITNSITDEEMYNKNCIIGKINIPITGIIIYYGHDYTNCIVYLGFDSIQNYIDNNAYTIQFDINNGNGTIPTSIIEYGNSSSLLIGNIENVIPTRTGYTFKGWSAVPELNEKRISYDNLTGTIQTSDSWTYADYCSYTGGDSSNRTLTLYAQWEANQYSVTYIDIDANGNEIGRTTQSADYDIFVKGSDIGGDKTDNAYYNQYKYVSDTSEKVTTDGAVVYRVFEFCETEAKANLQWNDNNNADGFRPEKYKLKLKQNGKVIDEIELSSDETNYTFSNLPKYDSNGNAYKYTFDVDASNRYQIVFDEDGNLIVEDYLPANFSVTIPKIIVLDGNTGNADYAVSVNGTFYYNDTLTVIPENSIILTDRSKISSMQADISQQKTVFMKEDGVASRATVNGSIQVDRSNFAGIWKGHFNFDIKFKMQN